MNVNILKTVFRVILHMLPSFDVFPNVLGIRKLYKAGIDRADRVVVHDIRDLN